MLQKLPVHALRRAGAAAAMLSAIAAASTVLAPTASAATVGCPPAPSFDFTVPTPAGPPSLQTVIDGDGLPDIAVSIIGADQQFYDYAIRFGRDSDQVGSLACESGATGFDHPASASPDQAFQTFMVSATGQVMEKEFTVTGITDWTPVPGASSRSGVDAIASGTRTDIFYVNRSATKEIMHLSEDGGVWSTPESLGGASNEVPSVTMGADGKLHVWVAGTNDKIYVNSGSTGTWTGWHALASGLTAHAPTAVIGYADASHEDVFVTGLNGGIYQTSLTNLANPTPFHRITDVPADARIDAAAQGTGHMVVMFTTTGETAVTQFFTGDSRWSDPFLPTYLCPDCAPAPAASGKSPAASPQASAGSLSVHQSASHHRS